MSGPAMADSICDQLSFDAAGLTAELTRTVVIVEVESNLLLD